MHLQIPDRMGKELSDGAWLRVVELTAEAAVVVANDLGGQLGHLRDDNARLTQELSRVAANTDMLHNEKEGWAQTAMSRLDSINELADIIASRLWHDLFLNEAGALDLDICAGRKISAIKQVRKFLCCGLFLAKCLVDARQRVLTPG